MTQAISDELLALLKSTLQAGPTAGFRGEIEIDWSAGAAGSPTIVQQVSGGGFFGPTGGYTDFASQVTPGNLVVAAFTKRNGGDVIDGGDPQDGGPVLTWTSWGIAHIRAGDIAGPDSTTLEYRIATGRERHLYWGVYNQQVMLYEIAGAGDPTTFSVNVKTYQAASSAKSLGALATPGDLQFASFLVDVGTTNIETAGTGYTIDSQENVGGGHPENVAMHGSAGATPQIASGDVDEWGGVAVGITAAIPSVSTATYAVAAFSQDRARGIAASQLDVTLPNENGDRGYYTEPDPVLMPNNPIRAYAWYGDIANRVRVFTGLIDRVHEARDPQTIELQARSRMKWLFEQQFIAIGGQSVSDAGAIRTEANGVYIGKSPEYIVGDILTRAGWPAGDRDLATSGVVVDEYDLADGSSWVDCIAGSNRLTVAAGFDFWEDELGIVHYRANALADVSPPSPSYTFSVGVDVMRLDHEADDQDRLTRIRVDGPMTSAVPAWTQEWATSPAAYQHPTGAAFRASESGYVYVMDRLSGYLLKIDQTSRVIAAKWDLSGSLAYQALGISIDPTDTTYFYVLDGNWRTGVNTHAREVKFRWSDKVAIDNSALADGQWSDAKFDGTHFWLTNFGDDKLYEKTYVAGGSMGATGSWSYSGHVNPTGLYLDKNGSTITLGLFFNGDLAFQLVSASAPGTITGTQSTKGTYIENGELDLSDHIHLYAVNDKGDFGLAAGYVRKFALATLVTADIVKWAYDQALEDALGFQSGIANRIHDLHPLDAAHPFEIRAGTYSMNVVNSEAQAQAVANAQLALLKQIRRVMDLATLGNPAIQINDVIRYTDPVANINSVWLIDSYRASLDASGTYTTTMSVLPWVAP